MFAFFVLSTSPGTDIKQFGIGLAAGIIFDATVIARCSCPPSCADGRWNWWMPLARGPDPPHSTQLGLTAAAKRSFRVFAMGDPLPRIPHPAHKRVQGCAPCSRAMTPPTSTAPSRSSAWSPRPGPWWTRLGLDWDYLEWLAVEASATVLAEQEEGRGIVVSYGGEAFTAGFLIGVHLRDEPQLEAARLDRRRRRRPGAGAPCGDRRPLRSGERRAAGDCLHGRAGRVDDGRAGRARRPAVSGYAHLRGGTRRRAPSSGQAATAVARSARSSPSRSSTRSSSPATGSNTPAGQTNMSSMSSRPSKWPCSQGSDDRVSTVCA